MDLLKRVDVTDKQIIRLKGNGDIDLIPADSGKLNVFGDVVIPNNEAYWGVDTSGTPRRIAHYSVDNSLRIGDVGEDFRTLGGNTIFHHGNSPKVATSATAPANPRVGDVWIDTSS
jgi:hypothetical protein